MTLATVDQAPSEDRAAARAAWNELGEEILAACERDGGTGHNAPTLGRFRELIAQHLRGWIDGTGYLQFGALHDWLDCLVTPWTPQYEAELETAVRYLTREARVCIAEECRRSGKREVSFALSRTRDGRFGDPRVAYRGNGGMVTSAAAISRPGELLLHNHPSGDLSPSDTDLENAMKWSHVLSAMPAEGIISSTADRLYLLRDPEPTPAPARDPAASP